MRGNSFLVCSACNEIDSAYAQHTHVIIKMQISPIKNPNFEKQLKNLSDRTKVKILKKNFFGYLSKKIWFRVCSVIAEMFEHRNSSENQRKRSEIFLENVPKSYSTIKRKFNPMLS